MTNKNDLIQNLETILKEPLEKYKVEDAIIILPFSNTSKKEILNNLEKSSDSYKIIHSSSKDDNLTISNNKTTDNQNTNTIEIELNTKKQLDEYLKCVKKILETIQNCKNLCPLGYIQAQNENVLSSLSHQIRTPLQGITSSASILEVKNQDPSYKKILKHLLNSCLDLNIYINDIMDFYLLKDKSMEMEYSSFELKSLLDEVKTFFDLELQEYNISYESQISIMLKNPIKTDYKRLKQIMRHLISNSIHFSHNETISLEIKKESNYIVFTLIDTGSGIKEIEREKVWMPFYQISKDWMTSQEGLGLGLTNTKMLCRELGGDIKFIDSPFDKGTAIQFHIKDMTDIEIEKEKVKPSAIINLTQSISSPITSIKSISNELTNKILIVEDHLMNAELIKLMLENKYSIPINDIDIIIDSRKVIEKIKTTNYQSIYLDLKMPHLSGFDILKLINDDSHLNEKYKNKVILITALAQNKETINLKENNLVNKIIFKPIRCGDL